MSGVVQVTVPVILSAVARVFQGFFDDSKREVMVASVLAQSAVAVPLTGTAAETTLATIALPAGAMGKNGHLRISMRVSATNNVNAKTIRFKLGALTAQASVASTLLRLVSGICVTNRNSEASQVFTDLDGTTLQTATIDTGAAQTITITGQLANGADTMTLESYLIELIPGA